MSVRRVISKGLLVVALAGSALAVEGRPGIGARRTQSDFVFRSRRPRIRDVRGSGSIAVDQSNGDVYVFDARQGAIYKFNSAGEPQEFTGLKADAIEGIGSGRSR